MNRNSNEIGDSIINSYKRKQNVSKKDYEEFSEYLKECHKLNFPLSKKDQICLFIIRRALYWKVI